MEWSRRGAKSDFYFSSTLQFFFTVFDKFGQLFEFDFLGTVWFKQLLNYQSKGQNSSDVSSLFATLCFRMDPHSGGSPT